MNIIFYGAAKSVTGSCYCVESNGKRVLVDCGLLQGSDADYGNDLPFSPASITCVIVTHAHIDHSGRLPLLAKYGYSGPVAATRLTAQLLGIMLKDSAHIQQSDADWENQKGKRAGKEPVEPLYTVNDAEALLGLIKTREYGEIYELCEGIRFSFTDSGHILGSASIEMWVTEGNVTKKIVFSGDIGNVHQPVIRDPQLIVSADYVVMESTYGDSNHEQISSYTDRLAAIMDETFVKGGNVIIPSFAVGRTQELLYFIREIKDLHLVKSYPDFAVYVDSPLAKAATQIFSGDLSGYLDDEALKLVRSGEQMFSFPGLVLVESSDESKAINEDKKPKVIISASGMCDAGRIRHHLKHNLWRPESAVVFVGFQVEGTLGRRLLDGTDTVRLFGEEIAVRAAIYSLQGLSAHADRDHLLAWADSFAPDPAQFFVTHGESEVAELFAASLRERGKAAHAPDRGEVYDLLGNRALTAGVPLVKKQAEVRTADPDAYRRFTEAGEKLADFIKRSRGKSAKQLRRQTDQLRSLLDKWIR